MIFTYIYIYIYIYINSKFPISQSHEGPGKVSALARCPTYPKVIRISASRIIRRINS